LNQILLRRLIRAMSLLAVFDVFRKEWGVSITGISPACANLQTVVVRE